MSNLICIYHGGCDDGFASAWVVKQALGENVDFHYGIYQENPPDVSERDVLLVDFSYKRPVLTDMAKEAMTVFVLDHHKSAADDLAGLPTAGTFQDWICPADQHFLNMGAQFDMNRSGATMTWDFFFPGEDRPWLLEYIEDRDLWRKELPNCDEIIMALRSYQQDFDVWSQIIENGPDAMLAEGRAIHRYYRTIVDALKENAVRQYIGGFHIPVVNSPFHFASEVAGELAEGEPFAACYWNHAHGTTYSLRSRDNGMDVSEIAAQYGGGGHRGAAGFKVPVPLESDGELSEATR